MKLTQIFVILSISLGVLLTSSTVYTNQEIIQAFAGETLSSDNVAKTIQVRINPVGTNLENAFDSFSRIGFVQGEANFL